MSEALEAEKAARFTADAETKELQRILSEVGACAGGCASLVGPSMGLARRLTGPLCPVHTMPKLVVMLPPGV